MKNRLNAVENADELTACARHRITHVASLSEKALNQTYPLPCECEEATLKELLKEYTCSACDTLYYYSFCMDEVVDAEGLWHCVACGTCREDSEWHCKHCN